MSESEKVMRLGADNRNFAPCATNGFAKRGVSVVLNQDTSNWIAQKNLAVGRLYLRSGRNFSSDWLSRANLDAILGWGICGIRKDPFQGMRG